MLNEGMIAGDTTAALMSEMVRQIRNLGEATPDQWERAVFKALTGHTREDVDWEVEDNQAGYFTWLQSFDHHAALLAEDGYIRRFEKNGEAYVKPGETDPAIDWSMLVGPTR